MIHNIVIEKPATCWRARCEGCGWLSTPELHKATLTRQPKKFMKCPNDKGETAMMNTAEHTEQIQRALGRLEGMVIEVYVNAAFEAASTNPLTVKVLHVGDHSVRLYDYTYKDREDEYPVDAIDRISIGSIGRIK